MLIYILVESDGYCTKHRVGSTKCPSAARSEDHAGVMWGSHGWIIYSLHPPTKRSVPHYHTNSKWLANGVVRWGIWVQSAGTKALSVTAVAKWVICKQSVWVSPIKTHHSQSASSNNPGNRKRWAGPIVHLFECADTAMKGSHGNVVEAHCYALHVGKLIVSKYVAESINS